MSWISNLFTGHKDNDKDKDKKQAKGKDKKKTEKQKLTPQERANGLKTIQICLIMICPIVFGVYYLIKQAVTAKKGKKDEKANKNGKPPSHLDNLIKADQKEHRTRNSLHPVNKSFENINTNNQNDNYEETRSFNEQNQKRSQKVQQSKNEEDDIEQENAYKQRKTKKHKRYTKNDTFDEDDDEEIENSYRSRHINRGSYNEEDTFNDNETVDKRNRYNRQRVNRNNSYDEEDNDVAAYSNTKNNYAANRQSEVDENQYNSLEQNSFTETNNQQMNDYQGKNVGYSADKVDENYGRRNYIEKVRNYGQQSRGNDPPEIAGQDDFNQQYENYLEERINNQPLNRRAAKHYDLNTCNDAKCKRCGGYRYY